MKASHLMWERMRRGEATREDWLDTVEREHRAHMAHKFSGVEYPPAADSAEQRTPGNPDPPNRKDRST